MYSDSIISLLLLLLLLPAQVSKSCLFVCFLFFSTAHSCDTRWIVLIMIWTMMITLPPQGICLISCVSVSNLKFACWRKKEMTESEYMVDDMRVRSLGQFFWSALFTCYSYSFCFWLVYSIIHQMIVSEQYASIQAKFQHAALTRYILGDCQKSRVYTLLIRHKLSWSSFHN